MQQDLPARAMLCEAELARLLDQLSEVVRDNPRKRRKHPNKRAFVRFARFSSQ